MIQNQQATIHIMHEYFIRIGYYLAQIDKILNVLGYAV